MLKKYSWLTLLVILPLVLVWGCGEQGKVDQGRVIAFDKAKNTVIMIRDLKGEIGKPDYNSLPPEVFNLPTDPNEMGPEPKAGKRMNLDTKERVITIFDESTQNFKKIPFTLIDMKEGVGKNSPLVADKKFPIVDKDKKAISVYSGRQKLLVTFSIPEEFFSMPDNTWEAGDEVRIYYRQMGKALRFMNISKTDIFKK